MLDKIRTAVLRFEQIEAALSDSSVMNDRDRYLELIKERNRLEPFASKYEEYEKLILAASEAQRIISSDSDPELCAMAQEELKELTAKTASIEQEFKIMLLPKEPDSEKNVIVEIRAGAGGEEAALFAADLFRMYCMYADQRGFSVQTVSDTQTELGGYREITFRVAGEGAYECFRFESGVHRVQRIPVTESNGKLHTSTATVAVLPEAEEVQVQIAPSDLLIETIKSSGAGGQHINKTESAVRVLHKPSGIVVEARNERSQLQNKEQALRILRTMLYKIKKEESDLQLASSRRSQIGSGDRSEKIRTYNYPQNRVTDHRIGLTLYSLDSILNGRMEELISALSAADAAEKLNGDPT